MVIYTYKNKGVGCLMAKIIPKTRLELLMKLTGVTGKVLSSSLHFDMSLISRWKNGKRKILNEDYLDDLAKFFFNYGNGQYKGIYLGLTNMSEDVKEQTVINGLKLWLSSPLVQDDLFHVGSMAHGKEQSFIKSYMGNEGRRQSVLEFLAMAIRLRSGGKIYLISHEEMSWLVEDATFLKQWSTALTKCIEIGYEIIVIHTVRLSMDELYKTFIQWVPFYMTGRVKAYFISVNQFEYQQQTLYIIEDLLICEGYLYSEDLKSRYTMLTNDPLTIQSRQQQYDQTLNKAKQLIYNYDREHLYQSIDGIISAGTNKENSLFKAEELFFTTMDKALLIDILIDNEVDETSKNRIIQFYDGLNDNFRQNIRLFTNRHIYNLNKLIQQAEQTRFQAVLLSIITGRDIMISREHYIRHLYATIQRLKDNPKYEIGLYLKQSTKLPLEELDFWVKEGYYLSMWSKKSYDFIQMSYEPSMVENIIRFYNQLWDMIPLIDKDKKHVINHLEKLIVIAEDGYLELSK